MSVRLISMFLAALLLLSNGALTQPVVELPYPDLESFEPSVAEALQDGRNELERALGAASSHEDSAAAYGELGRLYLAHHLMYAAEAAFVQAVEKDPDDFLWNYLLAYARQEQGKHAEAIPGFRKALLIEPGYLTAAFRLAQSELSDGQVAAAKKGFEALLSIQPDHVAALAGLARIAIRQRDYQKAIVLLGRALRINPAANQLHYPLAQALRQTGQTEAAKRQLAQAGQTQPPVADPVLAEVESLSRSGQLYLERGLALIRAGKDSMAVVQIQKAVSLNPDDAYAQATLGQALQLIGRISEAIVAFERALSLGLDEAFVHYRYGMALESLGRQEKADQQYADALVLDDGLREARLMLANSMMRSGRYADAETHYQYLAGADGSNAVFWYRLALVNLAQQECVETTDALDRALLIAPSDGGLLQVLARAYSVCPKSSEEQKRQALELARLIHDARPGVDTLETLAMASAANRRFADAESFQAQAMLRFQQSLGAPESRVEHMRLALNRYANGQPAEIAYSPGDPIMNPQVRRR